MSVARRFWSNKGTSAPFRIMAKACAEHDGPLVFQETPLLIEETKARQPMNTISREALKTKLDRGEPLKLIMVMPEWAYCAKHIPSSFSCITPEEAFAILSPDD